MPTQSRSSNVRKRCHCRAWKQCLHPWYVDYQVKSLRFRPNLDVWIGHHCEDFTEARERANLAVIAWLERLAQPYLLEKQKLERRIKRFRRGRVLLMRRHA